jgi:hypothetical protein
MFHHLNHDDDCDFDFRLILDLTYYAIQLITLNIFDNINHNHFYCSKNLTDSIIKLRNLYFHYHLMTTNASFCNEMFMLFHVIFVLCNYFNGKRFTPDLLYQCLTPCNSNSYGFIKHLIVCIHSFGTFNHTIYYI